MYMLYTGLAKSKLQAKQGKPLANQFCVWSIWCVRCDSDMSFWKKIQICGNINKLFKVVLKQPLKNFKTVDNIKDIKTTRYANVYLTDHVVIDTTLIKSQFIAKYVIQITCTNEKPTLNFFKQQFMIKGELLLPKLYECCYFSKHYYVRLH